MALTEVEVKRAEAAALLERRMSAMEAVLAARRSPPAQAPEPQAARGPGADLRFQVMLFSPPCRRHTCTDLAPMLCHFVKLCNLGTEIVMNYLCTQAAS